MALNNNFNFNFKPESTQTTSGDVTIPAGKYAFVTAFAENGNSFIVNGTTVLTSSPESIITRSIDIGLNDSDSFTVTSGHVFEGQAFVTISGRVEIDGVLAVTPYGSTTSFAGFGNIKAGSGQNIVISTNNDGGSSAAITGYDFREAVTSQGEFWLNSGDAITGNCKKTITFYQIP